MSATGYGKGSDQRPMKIDKKTFEDNWDRIFGKRKTKKDAKKDKPVKKWLGIRMVNTRVHVWSMIGYTGGHIS